MPDCIGHERKVLETNKQINHVFDIVGVIAAIEEALTGNIQIRIGLLYSMRDALSQVALSDTGDRI